MTKPIFCNFCQTKINLPIDSDMEEFKFSCPECHLLVTIIPKNHFPEEKQPEIETKPSENSCDNSDNLTKSEINGHNGVAKKENGVSESNLSDYDLLISRISRGEITAKDAFESIKRN